ncbi:hypothetical protein PV646_20485 [Streptomyces sp. ID05-26A]|nr:hypothetical protein [Streptomyces sp. ID05-26A]
MKISSRFVPVALVALASALLGAAPASAAPQTGQTAANATSDLCAPFGCYVSNKKFVGFYTVPGAAPLCSASAVGAGTITCGYNRTYTVTAGVNASVNVTLIKDSLMATFGVDSSLSKSITVTNGCTATVGARGGRVWGVPEYAKYEYLVRNRAVGGGGANDVVVGSGWIGVPSGMKCYFVQN